MKFVHISDLHLGKRVNEFSMVEDQAHILGEILRIVGEERPDGVLVAGDIYDKSVPSAEAVALFDDFLVALSKEGPQVFLISGNHDSPERIAFGGRLMEQSGIFISPVYGGAVAPIALRDAYGPLYVYLLPFVKPAHVRQLFPDRDIATYTDALAVAIQEMRVDPSARNVLVTHQFVTGAARCESEELSVGGADNVDASVFGDFDYVALGHLHGPQKVGRETIRYCGTPLKYSFSECRHEKSVTVVEMREKGAVDVRQIPLVPLRDMKKLRGTYAEVTLRAFWEADGRKDAYVHMTLTDEEDIPGVVGKLRYFYPYLMKLEYDNRRTRARISLDQAEDAQTKSPLELLESFYQEQNGQPMQGEQRMFAKGLLEEIWEGRA